MPRSFSILIFAAASLIIFSFKSNKDPFPGYKPAGNGSYFKMISKGGSSSKAEVGGLVFMHMKLKERNDHVFMDLNNNPQYPNQAFPLPIKTPRFKGDIMDLILKFSKGDSGSFFISLDSLKKYYADTTVNGTTGEKEIKNEFDFHNEAYDTMKYVGFDLRIDSVYNKARFDQLKADQEKRNAIRAQVEDTLGPIQAKARQFEPYLKANDDRLLKEYLAKNNVQAKPDANGIYFIETNSGSGVPLTSGTTVSVLYSGRYLDGTLFDSNELIAGQDLLVFKVGVDPMITGFTDCMLRMKKGGKATFIIPPSMGYRDSLTRVFDVQIMNPLK